MWLLDFLLLLVLLSTLYSEVKLAKAHHWVDYNRQGDTLEITVRDSYGGKRESWVVSLKDKKRLRQVLRALKEKWNVDLRTAILFKERDMEWLE